MKFSDFFQNSLFAIDVFYAILFETFEKVVLKALPLTRHESVTLFQTSQIKLDEKKRKWRINGLEKS